jgi:Tannase and feruloyl esterase
MRLPLQWNGRLLYQGGGGSDGVIRPAVGSQAEPGYALNRGFAVGTTDAGHQGPTADFGFDPIARTDNAYNAHDKVAVTAKELLRRHYGRPAERAYFIGCSGGGAPGHDVHAALSRRTSMASSPWRRRCGCRKAPRRRRPGTRRRCRPSPHPVET